MYIQILNTYNLKLKTFLLPNTLGHIGIQAPLCKLIFKKAELQWITIGCLIPDLPWITQRLLLQIPLIDPYAVAYYTTIQSSLFFSIVLAAAFSLFSRNPPQIFLLLLFNCVLHLLLDACQIKWGNGVLLFAPLSWHYTQFNLFWPEDPVSYCMTGLGLFYLLFSWQKSTGKGVQLSPLAAIRKGALLAVFLFYLMAPFFFFHHSEAANNRYLKTLQESEQRQGKLIEFDRVPYTAQEKSMKTFSHETILLTGQLPKETSLLSIKGKFITINTIDVTDVHIHTLHRDWASYLGLLLILMLWIETLYKQKNKNNPDHPRPK